MQFKIPIKQYDTVHVEHGSKIKKKHRIKSNALAATRSSTEAGHSFLLSHKNGTARSFHATK